MQSTQAAVLCIAAGPAMLKGCGKTARHIHQQLWACQQRSSCNHSASLMPLQEACVERRSLRSCDMGVCVVGGGGGGARI